MAKKLIRFEVDEDIRLQTAVICKMIGIDIQTYLNMCLKRSVIENGLPFNNQLQDNNDQKD